MNYFILNKLISKFIKYKFIIKLINNTKNNLLLYLNINYYFHSYIAMIIISYNNNNQINTNENTLST